MYITVAGKIIPMPRMRAGLNVARPERQSGNCVPDANIAGSRKVADAIIPQGGV